MEFNLRLDALQNDAGKYTLIVEGIECSTGLIYRLLLKLGKWPQERDALLRPHRANTCQIRKFAGYGRLNSGLLQ
jgi:hypothetical protein